MTKEKVQQIGDEPKKNVQPDEGAVTLKDLVEKNIKWSQVIYEQNRGIKRRLTLLLVGGYLKLLLIVVPLILAFIYLPPLLKDLFAQYSSLLGGLSGASNGGQLDVGSILNQVSPDQIQQIMKTLGQ
ncbi:MAG: hypothetical protein A2921_03330 [Candidatus Magasanikbacteria bacterium RIFCSPLOWO2_01_FULL_43_20b]|uniref:Uncharacterized protein n=1 Tax=Candidatus Magasanikbacteria bacterium RIFCSPLOWO2_12_FULL_43_12 TaxID=1798692 RepID=A0A1F6MQY6_9BACT|nr:MAG: hypothetical protein A3C74_01960 [Candidatus Magasanikbacteria bacterium RIFCSPHIGHO2_02_FULL_44_13]OGH73453.1 MAG: hypothetical protein A2921_03330 [Candidatus Magasanikbacteria bacterium RIFCSPLOWO2_01_FULL_43_20b]OGH74071.1 MAG: hypothetical protein A3G00_02125 [Candidatus Magasanikbacteria bacterium RIFCSPLOWO2_12_FULL_43_12]